VTIAIMAAPSAFWERIGTLWSDEYATSTTADSAIDSQLQRKELLLDSLRYTINNPIFGLGMGNFQIYHGTEAHNSQEWKGTHNSFTQISSEAGIPALGMFLFLFYSVFRRAFWVARKCGKRPELALLKLMARATMVAAISFMIGGFFAHVAYFSFVYYVPAIAVGLQVVLDRHLAGDKLIAKQEGMNGGIRLTNGLAESGA
jgi:O-antigen ligase